MQNALIAIESNNIQHDVENQNRYEYTQYAWNQLKYKEIWNQHHNTLQIITTLQHCNRKQLSRIVTKTWIKMCLPCWKNSWTILEAFVRMLAVTRTKFVMPEEVVAFFWSPLHSLFPYVFHFLMDEETDCSGLKVGCPICVSRTIFIVGHRSWIISEFLGGLQKSGAMVKVFVMNMNGVIWDCGRRLREGREVDGCFEGGGYLF